MLHQLQSDTVNADIREVTEAETGEGSGLTRPLFHARDKSTGLLKLRWDELKAVEMFLFLSSE